MNPGENPLDQLRDIQLPETMHRFELAPVWWILIALLVAMIGVLLWRWYRRQQALRLLKPAQKELQAISQLTADNHAIAELSGLLKRLCLIYFPKKQVASLSGIKWIDFLNQQSATPIFDEQAKQIFAETAYRPNQTLDNAHWKKLILQSEQIIKAIFDNNVRVKS